MQSQEWWNLVYNFRGGRFATAWKMMQVFVFVFALKGSAGDF